VRLLPAGAQGLSVRSWMNLYLQIYKGYSAFQTAVFFIPDIAAGAAFSIVCGCTWPSHTFAVPERSGQTCCPACMACGSWALA
jgi:hypothetical protein